LSDWVNAYKTAGAVGFLLIFIVVSLIYMGKYFKQILESTFKKTDDLQRELLKQGAEKEKFYKNQLEMLKQEYEINIAEVKKELKEERVNSEKERKKFIENLEAINQNTAKAVESQAKTASILEKLEFNFNEKLDNLKAEIKNIKEYIN
jgi:1,4-alpha-glucan branching enzyme